MDEFDKSTVENIKDRCEDNYAKVAQMIITRFENQASISNLLYTLNMTIEDSLNLMDVVREHEKQSVWVKQMTEKLIQLVKIENQLKL